MSDTGSAAEPLGVAIVREELRTPRAAGVAGVIFAVILIAVLVLLHTSIPPGLPISVAWVFDPSRRQAIGIALNLIPFAGIAFLWFIGVIRSRLGNAEDKLFATVFLGSGLLFVALLFSSAAVLAALMTLSSQGDLVGPESLRLLQTVTRTLMGSFGARMAAVFTASVSSLGIRTGALPRWLAVLGAVTAIILLLTPPLSAWAQMLFPVWVLLVSIHLLAWDGRRPKGTAAGTN